MFSSKSGIEPRRAWTARAEATQNITVTSEKNPLSSSPLIDNDVEDLLSLVCVEMAEYFIVGPCNWSKTSTL